ncbi:MAG: (2Fe-2S)-binding protein [Rhodoblastus sp.]
MIVCSCNRITDRAVRACAQAADGRPLRVLAVYGALGCKPECGRCAQTIAAILREQREISCACTPDGCPCGDSASGIAAA